jgi:hypothetical protein
MMDMIQNDMDPAPTKTINIRASKPFIEVLSQTTDPSLLVTSDTSVLHPVHTFGEEHEPQLEGQLPQVCVSLFMNLE